MSSESQNFAHNASLTKMSSDLSSSCSSVPRGRTWSEPVFALESRLGSKTENGTKASARGLRAKGAGREEMFG